MNCISNAQLPNGSNPSIHSFRKQSPQQIPKGVPHRSSGTIRFVWIHQSQTFFLEPDLQWTNMALVKLPSCQTMLGTEHTTSNPLHASSYGPLAALNYFVLDPSYFSLLFTCCCYCKMLRGRTWVNGKVSWARRGSQEQTLKQWKARGSCEGKPHSW